MRCVRECINAPEECPHGTNTSRTAYTRGTHSKDVPPIAAHACVLSTSFYFVRRCCSCMQELAAGKRSSAEKPLKTRCDEELADVRRYVEWLYLGVVNEQHAEQLFVLADRLTDTHAAAARLLAATRGGRVRADVSAWWQLVIVAGAAAAGVLVLSSRVQPWTYAALRCIPRPPPKRHY